MKTVIQRVERASVTANGETRTIKKGLLILVGLETGDTLETCKKHIEKIPKLRIFEDAGGKTNLSLMDLKGEILWVSQFTLAADLSSGNRPSFTTALAPDQAKS